MNLDLDKFKKLKPTKTHEVYQHPDGHEIHISKGHRNEMKEDTAIQPQQEAIAHAKNSNKKLEVGTQKYSGEDKKPEEQVVSDENAPAGQSPEQFLQQSQLGVPNSPDDPNSAASQQMAFANQPPERTNVGIPSSQPIGQQQDVTGIEDYKKGLENVRTGITQETEGQAKTAEAQATGAAKESNALQDANQRFQMHSRQNMAEVQNALKDYQSGHIDPNHWYASKDTGDKLRMGVGMLLAGLGGNVGSENSVVHYISKQIDRDIDAQKANMGNKLNVYHGLLAKYHNVTEADNMMRAIRLEEIKQQTLSAMANNKSQIAQGAGQQALGQLNMQQSQILAGLSMKQAIMGGNAAGQISPEQAIPYVVPKEQQKEVTESVNKVRGIEALRGDLKQANQQLDSMAGRGTFSPSAASAIKDALAAKLTHVTAGRFNLEESKAQINSVLHSKMDFSKETQGIKDKNIDTLMDTLRSEHEAPLKTYRLNIPRSGSGFKPLK